MNRNMNMKGRETEGGPSRDWEGAWDYKCTKCTRCAKCMRPRPWDDEATKRRSEAPQSVSES
jgi:hypothetical protein